MDEIKKKSRSSDVRCKIWHRKAAALMASGKTFRETAQELNVAHSTIIRWAKRPEFAAMLDREVSSLMSEFHRKNNRNLLSLAEKMDAICDGTIEATPTRLAAIQTKYKWSMEWHVVRKIEDARRRMEDEMGELK